MVKVKTDKFKGTALLEQRFEKLFHKMPVQLPANARETLVRLLPWLNVAIIILALPAIFSVFTTGTVVGTYATSAGTDTGPLYWFATLILLIQVVMMAAAIPALFNRQRLGWVLMYYGGLFGLVYVLINWLDSAFDGVAFRSLGLSLLLGLATLYLLFQARIHYKT